MEGLRTELMDTVLRLANGGLGSVKDSLKFELKLAKCTKLADFAPLVNQLQVRHITGKDHTHTDTHSH